MTHRTTNSRMTKRFVSLAIVIVMLVLVGSTVTAEPTVPTTTVWQETIVMNEAAFPTATTTLQSGSGSVVSTYDVLMPTGVTGAGNTIYALGQDGVDDIQLTTTVVDGSGGTWTQVEADYATTSSGSFRSDYTVPGPNVSEPNDYAYVKFDFEFIGGFQNCNEAEFFDTTHTSTNGSSEAYEWTQITLNGVTIPEGSIGNYTNADYSVFGTPTGSGAEFPNNVTMSEFLTNSASGTYAPGGLIMQGWWAIDDFNTDIFDAPEAASANPLAGNGSIDDNSTISGSMTNDSGDGNFGYADGTNITQITYWFGLTDVGYDENGDGVTHTNTFPSAGVTEFNVGCSEEKVLAVDMNSADTTTAFATNPAIMMSIVLLGAVSLFALNIERRHD